MSEGLDKVIDTTDTVSHAPEMGCPPANFKDPSEDDGFINLFPELVLLPADPSTRKAFEDRYSILTGERIRRSSLLERLTNEANQAKTANAVLSEQELRKISWRALHRITARTYDHGADDYVRDAEWFISAVQGARVTVEHLIEEYMPLRLHRQLEMDPNVAGECDPIQLMRTSMSSGTDVLARTRGFEAQRQLALAQLNYEDIRLYGPRNILKGKLKSFVDLCEEELFVPGKSEQVTVIAKLDPANAHRVSSFKVVPRNQSVGSMILRDTQIVLPLDVRFVADNGGMFPVFFDARVKEHSVIKKIAKRARRSSLTDLWAVQWVAFNEEHDLMRIIDLLRRGVVIVPGTISGEASNAQRAGVLDPMNHHSSHEYRSTKYDMTFCNWVLELAFKYLPIFVNELVSRGRDCHRLYKLWKYLDLVFPVIFPTALYGIDWRDLELRQLLWNFQLHRL